MEGFLTDELTLGRTDNSCLDFRQSRAGNTDPGLFRWKKCRSQHQIFRQGNIARQMNSLTGSNFVSQLAAVVE
ncbi:hypothetical protein [Hoeflea sp.]|uniref:hypothetical protein n=1 Tax=Hoeflea sp. TaxID=1940281 RepID=UPI003B02ABB4